MREIVRLITRNLGRFIFKINTIHDGDIDGLHRELLNLEKIIQVCIELAGNGQGESNHHVF